MNRRKIVNNLAIRLAEKEYKCYVDEITAKQYGLVLAHGYSAKYNDNVWNVNIASSNKSGKIKFAENEYIDLIKCFTIYQLSMFSSIGYCKQSNSDVGVFLEFLSLKNFRLENTRTATISVFRKYLDSQDELPISRKNSIMRDTGTFLTFTANLGIITDVTIDCSFRWHEKRMPKRAPDICVIHALDRAFFLNNCFPNEYCCIYYLLRMISNRISEVLEMTKDCLSYSADGTFGVEIPTSKETSSHIPIYNKNNRIITGLCECKLHNALIQRIRDVHPDSDKLFDITTSEFNTFLAKVCEEMEITDAVGNTAKITSHDFRHVAIVERLQSKEISASMTMKESNHCSIEQTMGYGYPSVHDDTVHNNEITQKALNLTLPLLKHDPQTLNKMRYSRLLYDPYTRIIPQYGICCEKACTPRYANCFSCVHFHPDKTYRSYFEDAIEFIDKKLLALNERHGDISAIEFNKEQKSLFELFLTRIEEVTNEDEEAK